MNPSRWISGLSPRLYFSHGTTSLASSLLAGLGMLGLDGQGDSRGIAYIHVEVVRVRWVLG
jgi:hypothetical protein